MTFKETLTEWGCIPSHWVLVEISSVADVVDPHPSHRAPKEVENNGYPFAGIGDIDCNGNIACEKARQISEEFVLKQESAYEIKDGTIGYGRVGTVGKVVRLKKQKYRYALSPTLAVINGFDINNEFLFHILNSKPFFYSVETRMTGTTRPAIGIQQLRKLHIPLPPKKEQEGIANILGSIDKKIYLNSQTNQTLEEMAQAIFKSWFVDFDPVKAKMNGEQPEGMDAATASLFPEKLIESELGLIPEGWDAGTLSDVSKYCSARTSIDSICLNNYISTENMLADRKGVTTASKLPTAKMVAAYKTGDVLVSNIRPYFKKIWLAEGNGGRSNDVLGFESSVPNTDAYIMNLLYQDTFFEYMTRTSKGAKMPRGDKTAIMNWEIAVPPVELREAYTATVGKFYKLILENRAQNETLESLRDALLPKLLSGEIELGTSEEL